MKSVVGKPLFLLQKLGNQSLVVVCLFFYAFTWLLCFNSDKANSAQQTTAYSHEFERLDAKEKIFNKAKSCQVAKFRPAKGSSM